MMARGTWCRLGGEICSLQSKLKCSTMVETILGAPEQGQQHSLDSKCAAFLLLLDWCSATAGVSFRML